MGIVDLMRQAKADAFPEEGSHPSVRAFGDLVGRHRPDGKPLDDGYVSRIESGQRNPSPEVIDAWFAALGRRLVAVPADARGTAPDLEALPGPVRAILYRVARELGGALRGEVPELIEDDIHTIVDAVLARIERRRSHPPSSSATSQDKRAKRS